MPDRDRFASTVDNALDLARSVLTDLDRAKLKRLRLLVDDALEQAMELSAELARNGEDAAQAYADDSVKSLRQAKVTLDGFESSDVP